MGVEKQPSIKPFAEYKPGSKVHWAHPKDVIDRAIAIPDELRDSDGRVLHMRSWTASVSEHGVSVTGTFLVSFPEDK